VVGVLGAVGKAILGDAPSATAHMQPIGIQPDEGSWSVRLGGADQPIQAVQAIRLSLEADLATAYAAVAGPMPTLVVSGSTEEHARELADRLGRVGAQVEVIQSSSDSD
jgi:hypothetical protein